MKQEKTHFSLKEAILKGVTELLVLISAILFFFIIYKFKTIMKVASTICAILMPIILGLVLAYLINPMVVFFERHMERLAAKKISSKKKKRISMRMPAIFLSLVILMLIFYFLAYLVMPQIYTNIRNLIYNLPGQMNKLMEQLSELMKDDRQLSALIDSLYKEGMAFLTEWAKTDMIGQITLVLSGMVGVVRMVVDFFVGLIVAVYVLASKETLLRQSKMLLRAFFSDDTAEKIKEIMKESNRIFGGFISGKLIDSLIIGILCFIGALILRLPYAVLISVIVGVTNIIPFFGPYIGAVPSAFLILLESPSKGVIFIIFILLLQQFDGNILGPKILGESTGLSPFWVIFSILLGSGLFGVVGMIIGVPTFAVIYYLIKSFIHYRLELRDKEE